MVNKFNWRGGSRGFKHTCQETGSTARMRRQAKRPNGSACRMRFARPVGRLQILVRRCQGEATMADVELSIFNDDRYIDLGGSIWRCRVRQP